MVGNDIVDLQWASCNTNWQRRGYLQKICSDCEINSIYDSPEPNKMVWLYWSMKETAYKYINRVLKHRFYNPVKLYCSIEYMSGNNVIGKVQFGDMIILTSSLITADYISTFTRNSTLDSHNVTQLIMPFDQEEPGLAMRKTIFSYLWYQSMQKPSRFSIIKDDYGIPFLFNEQKQMTFPISMSYHGRFCSFALPKNALA